MRPACIPLLSSVSNRYEADPLSIRDNLVDQLTEPVRYPELIHRLVDDGIGLLIEVGPKQVLTGLHRAILPSIRGAHVHCIASDNPKQSGSAILDQVQAMWECLGGHSASTEPSLEANSAVIPVVAKPQSNTRPRGAAIVFFDATTRRKESLKQAHGADSQLPFEPAMPRPLSKANGQRHTEAIAAGPHPAAPKPNPQAPPRNAFPVVTPKDVPVQPNEEASHANRPAAAALPSQDLEAYLIAFVVDQTGYPPELVELDADLEADLGIDSIKKAQLFGELHDHFEISASSISNLALDQFPTLRHIVEFLRTATQRDRLPAIEANPAHVAASLDRSLATHSAPLVTPHVEITSTRLVTSTSQPTPATSAVVAEAIPQVEPPSLVAESAESLEDLEQFLVTFVVDQTGYPPELVELDADLEADLGIDSIKKAQLFGELHDHFDLATVDKSNLTLDKFATLRHIVEFLRSIPRRGRRTPHSVGAAAAAISEDASEEPPACVEERSITDPDSSGECAAAKAPELPRATAAVKPGAKVRDDGCSAR